MTYEYQFLPFCHSRKNFTDHFVTARVDSGIAFSIKFLSSSALLGFRKAQGQDAMSSLARVASVSVGFPCRFRCFGRAKIKARPKKERRGRVRGEKETLADKPLKFENRPLVLLCLRVLREV